MAGGTFETVVANLQSTLPAYTRNNITTAWPVRAYPLTEFFHKNLGDGSGNGNAGKQAGISYRHTIDIFNDTGAQWVTPYDQVVPARRSNPVTIETRWASLAASWAISDQEIQSNKGDFTRIYNMVAQEQNLQIASMMSKMETSLTFAPQTNPDDMNNPATLLGLAYHFPLLDAGTTQATLDAQGTGRFLGKTVTFSDGSTSTKYCGVDRNVVKELRTYADLYTNVDNGLLEKFDNIIRYTRMGLPDMIDVGGNKPKLGTLRIYANGATCNAIKTLQRYNREDIRRDLGENISTEVSYEAMYCGIPIVHLPSLDDVPTAPIYIKDSGMFKRQTLGDIWFKMGEPMSHATQQQVKVWAMFCTALEFSTNPKYSGGVIHKAY